MREPHFTQFGFIGRTPDPGTASSSICVAEGSRPAS
jgi:hypothetical protein